MRPLTRVTVQTEDLQDTTKFASSLMNPAEVVAAVHTFERFDLDVTVESIPPGVLYTLDVSTDARGTYRELRTREEAVAIIAEYMRFSSDRADAFFSALIDTDDGQFSSGMTTINVTPVDATFSAPPASFRDICPDPDAIGTASYRAAEELAMDATGECPTPDITLDQAIAIAEEMGVLLEASLAIAGRAQPIFVQ